MVELVRWLGEQLDEDERIARAIEDEEQHWSPGDKNLGSAVIGAEHGGAVVVGPYDYLDWSVREHIAAHDPARVLRDIAAKRDVLRLYTETGDLVRNAASDEHRDTARIEQVAITDVLRLLALPYADRPGYREGWRP